MFWEDAERNQWHETEAATSQMCSMKKVFYKKDNLAQVFSCEFCEISKNTFFQNTCERLLLMK